MKATKVFLIVAILVSLGSAPAFTFNIKECDKIEAKIEIENATSGQSTGRVKVNLIKGDIRSVKYIFCKSSGEVLNEGHFRDESLTGLAKGEYLCIISTSECTKKISFTIN